MRIGVGSLTAIALCGLSSCSLFHARVKPKTPVQVIEAPPVTPPPPPPKVEAPPRVENPKTTQIQTLPEAAQPRMEAPTKPAVKPPRVSKKTPAAVPKPVAPPPAPTETTAEAPPTTGVPQLAPLLTQQQQQAYNAAVDAAIGRAQANLGRLGNRRLTEEQLATRDRVRAFIQQATEARATDLKVAKSLAERADLLADDLARSLR